MSATITWQTTASATPTPASHLRRLVASTWRQTARSRLCPDSLALDGKRALITGGNAGIGFATCRGLLRLGAEVAMLSRNSAKAEAACQALRGELGASVSLYHQALDLSDLTSVRDGSQALAERLDGPRVDVLVCNAGIWPRHYSTSPQGHELAFATNVLGHFLLLRRAAEQLLAPGARVVILTGDIYVLARDCTPDYAYRTPLGGMLAYCRSKLGSHWLAAELRHAYPGLEVVVVHPGVVATNLGGSGGSVGAALRRHLLIDLERGAQTSLYAAAEPGLQSGAYLHNTLGPVLLRDGDAACDRTKSRRLWARCEALCAEFL